MRRSGEGQGSPGSQAWGLGRATCPGHGHVMLAPATHGLQLRGPKFQARTGARLLSGQGQWWDGHWQGRHAGPADRMSLLKGGTGLGCSDPPLCQGQPHPLVRLLSWNPPTWRWGGRDM